MDRRTDFCGPEGSSDVAADESPAGLPPAPTRRAIDRTLADAGAPACFSTSESTSPPRSFVRARRAGAALEVASSVHALIEGRSLPLNTRPALEAARAKLARADRAIVRFRPEDAFDAGVLIYAAVPEHHLGRRVRGLSASDVPEPPDSVLVSVPYCSFLSFSGSRYAIVMTMSSLR